MRSSYITLFTPGLTDESIGKSGVKGARRGQTIMAGDGVAAGEKGNRVGRKSLQRSFPRIPVEAERRGERRKNKEKPENYGFLPLLRSALFRLVLSLSSV